MAKKAIITAVVLLLVYHFAFPHLSRHFFKIFGQQRLNYQVAQHYVFDVPTDTNVVAGSSMAEKLDDELLGPSFCKLTLPGGSVFTSLEMISLAQKHPRIILIETNVLSRDSDKDLLHDLFNPWMAVLRRHSNIFREEGRPSNFVAGFADACVQKSGLLLSRVIHPGSGVGSSESSPPSADEVRAQWIRVQREGWNAAPAAALVAKNTALFGDYVDSLTARGSLCILFEMPVDSELSNLRASTIWRKAVNERFPPDRYHWAMFDQTHKYQTRDGVHLLPAEAIRVTQELLRQVHTLDSGRLPAEWTHN